MEVISRAEAKNAGMKYYFTGVPCKRGHLAYRQVSRCVCVECGRLWKTQNKMSCNKTLQSWRERNPEAVIQHRKRSYQNNKETHLRCTAVWREQNRERVVSTRRSYLKKYSDRVNACNAIRRAARIDATPCWLNEEMEEEMRSFYTEAREITKQSGVKHVVDHIVPLRGKTVCGLHVPWNLRVITETENSRKQATLQESEV